MRSKSFATLGALTLLTAASAFAEKRLTVDIPFEFRVGTSVMPAGHYNVNRSFISIPGMLRLACDERGVNTTAHTFNIGGGHDARAEGRLVFHKYGDTYFLAEVWSANNDVGSALPKSRTERELARSTSLPTSQIVLVRQ